MKTRVRSDILDRQLNYKFDFYIFCYLQEDSEEFRQIWVESALERVTCASDACLTALYVMTSPSMPKRIFLEDVIDRIIMFIKFQLNNTIYCVYDPVYSIQSTSKKKGKITLQSFFSN